LPEESSSNHSFMRYPLWLTAVFLIVLIWSGINPHDSFTWILEVFPAILGFFILLFTYKRFPLTYFLYTLILIHAIILCVGGHYTYAEVPLFDWIRDALGQSRNNYDKVGHLAQGFVPVFIAREIFIRRKIIN
jgi:putative membrane protein